MKIEEIQSAYRNGSVIYSAHCVRRMGERNITEQDIENGIMTGQIIEEYPELDSELSYASYLIMGLSVDNNALHIVVGYKNIRLLIISTYYPDDLHWESDKMTRRKSNV